jgi:predicted dehydrogenase
MKDIIGVGIIGTGFARRTQIPAFAANKKSKIVSVSSGSFSNAESTAAEFDIPHFTDDWRETVSHAEVDLVCITTPPNLHLEMTKFCLENGKHVLCEKPMAMDTAESEEMARIAETKGVLAIIDHELRFTNGRLNAYEMIRKGKIGKIRHAKYLFRNASRGDESLPWTWWSDFEQGGGALGAIGSHVIDSLCWFTSADIEEVNARLHTHIKSRPFGDGHRPVTTDDENLMILKFGESPLVDDATASVSISLIESGPYRNRIEFFGNEGALRIEDGGEIFFADMKSGVWEPVEIDLGGVAPGMQLGGWSRGFLAIADKVIEALRNGETKVANAATFEDGVMIQRVLDAARVSDSKRCAVAVK